MDPIYNNKKYFQSLNHGNDYYRTGTMRHLGNDYSSYHNTLGGGHRTGTLLPHASPSSVYNKYSYATDLSLSSNSHYGYTSWGLWRGAGGPGTDSRNISPSIYSHHNGSKKRRRNIKSFSILLMSAAMIVVLAVLAVAGLAFYFSTFKSDQTDSILIFDSTMSVTKGDIFTASLKNPQSLAYQQKSNFYERLLRNALEHAGLTVAKINISSFGDGPFINLTFRVFLDMRKIQVTINNVEEHMKNAFLNEIALPVPEYKELFVNPDSIHIKRLLDQDVLRSASFIHPGLDSNESPKVIETGKAGIKKPGIIERPLQKFSSSSSSTKMSSRPITTTDKSNIHEPDIDLDSLTVIQGSFEVTKTEADITRNRETLKTTSTLKPFMVSPASIKISDGNKKNGNKVIEVKTNNTSSEVKRGEAKIEKTDKVTVATSSGTKKASILKTTTTTTTTTTTKPVSTTVTTTTPAHYGSTEKMIDTTVDQTKKIQNKNSEMISKPKPGSIGMQVLKDLLKTEIVNESFEPKKNVTNNVAKLDLNLFTNAPVIDEEPWHPINPNTPKIEVGSDASSKKENETEPVVEKHSVKKASPPQMTIKDELLMYRNKMPTLDSIEQSYVDGNGGLIYYKAFNNPGFTERTVEIEHLGAMDVRPYPLPVNKLTDDPTQFAYDLTEVATPSSLNVTVNQDKFEYLGGGVIVKRPEVTSSTTQVVANVTEATTSSKTTVNESDEEELESIKVIKADKNINETYFGENKLESRAGDSDIEAIGSGEKLSIVNLKDYIMQNKFKPTETSTRSTTQATVEVKPVTEPIVTSTADTSSVWNEAPQLFPIGSKWEFVNGTRVTPFENMGMRKVYNETLQALVVENSQLPSVGDLDDIKAQKPNMTDVNLPGISSLFDTIASKIGIEEESSSKTPPFSTHNKVKVTTQAMRTTTVATTTTRKLSSTKTTTSTQRPTTTTKRPTTNPRIIYKQTTSKTTTTTTKAPRTTKPSTTTTRSPPPSSSTTTERQIPVIVYRTSDVSPTYFDTSSESMFMGEAEVEVVDPNAYEDILKQSQVMSSSTTPIHTTTPRNTPLVTLLPVKSNSGIRNFNRDKLKHSPGIMQSAGTSSNSQEKVSNKSFNSRGPIFADSLKESIVKTSMNVEV